MTIRELAREEIRDLHAYQGAAQLEGALRLHANEAPRSIVPSADSLNRYPEIRPQALQSHLALHFGVSRENILVTRGSSEAIDLMIRSFCRTGRDNIVITPPTFAMYRVYADIQGAETIECPLLPEQDFAIDVESLLETCTANSKLIFICSPNNPSGNLVPRSDIIRLLEARRGKTIVVVDEAYIEFSGTDSLADLVTEHENLVVLRTLSKALALAGARCGVVIGHVELVGILNCVLAPYALATPVIDCVMQALACYDGASDDNRIGETIAERQRVAEKLAACESVDKVWPSQANFLLVKFRDLAETQLRLQAERILIRDFSSKPGLGECARITIGSPDDNDRLLAALN